MISTYGFLKKLFVEIDSTGGLLKKPPVEIIFSEFFEFFK
jgi:hypothetical protein